MKRNGYLIGGLLGGATAFVVAVLGELASRLFGLPGVAFSLFDWMARILPGPLITLFIGTMVKMISALSLGPTAQVAKQIEQGSAILMFTGLGVLFGLVLTAMTRQKPGRLATYGMWGGVVFLVAWLGILMMLGAQQAGFLASILWWGVLLMGWGWTLGRLIEYLAWPGESGVPDASRRRFLYLVGAGSFTVLVTAAGISLAPGSRAGGRAIPQTGAQGGAGEEAGAGDIANAATTSGPARSPDKAALAGRFQPAAGTRPELTANADFYRIDINTVPPRVDAAQWKLDIKGLVERPAQLTLDAIRARPAVSQAVTLECISNEVGGDLTSTSLWTGARLKDVLAEVGVKPGAQEIYMTAADGFYESMPIAEAMDERTLLVYAMNNAPLPAEHGFPLRIYIPNHFGMKQPKWLASLEVIDHHATGYWVERGWSNEAIPPTTSVIDVIGAEAYDPQTGLVPVGGIAYAGARGISKVEVQVDDGPWEQADLRTPALSPLTWVQWRYLWKSKIGQHTFRVRAYDGTGAVQTDAVAPPEPSGATGIHTESELISAGEK